MILKIIFLEQMERPQKFPRELEKHFFEAIATGDLETVLMFLEAGIDPYINKLGRSMPLHTAVYTDQLAIVHLLLDIGINPNIRDRWGNTPLGMAKTCNYPAIAELLQQYGAE